MSIWLMQGGLDFLFLVLAIMLWWNQHEPVVAEGPDERIASALRALEERTRDLEREAIAYRQKMEEELASVSRLVERAKGMVALGQSNYPPSDEEYELKAAVSAERSAEPEPQQIPTLHQVEKTRQRLRSEISVDLRTLLSDQLA